MLSHAAILGWFVSDWTHFRLLLFSFQEAHSEETVNEHPDDLALHYGYAEDAVQAVARYRPLAAHLTNGVTSAPERARRLGDYIYSLRRPSGALIGEDLRYGPEVLYQKMLEGHHGNCGQMSTVLALFWRSLGSHTRGVRWGTYVGEVGHYAIELWDSERERWFYYDMNLNGYAYDDHSQLPLSVASLRSNLLTGEHLHIAAHPTHRDYTLADLETTVRQYPVETYVLNNEYMRLTREQRFGLFNRYYGVLSELPHPWDRVVDNLTGTRDRQLVVRGRLQVAGMLSLGAAKVFLFYLVGLIIVCGVTLQRRWSAPREGTHRPTAGDTRP